MLFKGEEEIDWLTFHTKDPHYLYSFDRLE